MSDEDVERLLRATLAERAGQAPDAASMTDQVLAAVGLASPPPVGYPTPTSIDAAAARSRQRQHRRARFLVPLASAASVAAVVGLGLLLANNGSTTSSGSSAGGAISALSATAGPVVPNDGGISAVPRATSQSAAATQGAPSVASTDNPLPNGFQLVDLTYDSDTSAYALGTVPCALGRCTTLTRTTDGSTWQVTDASLPFKVSGAADPGTSDVVTHVRFANASVGYAYGTSPRLLASSFHIL